MHINTQSRYSSVSKATMSDIGDIQLLLNHYASMGDLLPRAKQDIISNLEHFRVIRDSSDNKVVACGSLENFTKELAEIRSLMVSSDIKQSGLGTKIVTELIELAQIREVKRLMALTYVPVFFHKLGFKTVDKAIFPEKIWGICVNCYKFDNCDEIAVLLEL